MLPRRAHHCGFKPRKVGLKRTPFERGAAGHYSTLKRSKLKKVGKVGRRNARALRVFKKECVRQDVDGRCEVRYAGCFGEATTWAHGKRRRLLTQEELEALAVAACAPCHAILDTKMSREECEQEVHRLIALRPERRMEAA